MDYKEQLDHPQWQRRRLEKMQSANWKCEICASECEKLHVHHKRYRDGVMAWMYQDNELQCLCATCHQIAHLNPRKVVLNAEIMGMKQKTAYSFFSLHHPFNRMVVESGHPMEKEWLDMRGEMHAETCIIEKKWMDKIEDFRARYESITT